MTGIEQYIFTKKALIFDMDGTIVDNIAYHNEARLIFLQKHKVKFPFSETKAILNLSTKEIVKRFFSEYLSSEAIKALDNEKQYIYRKIYSGNVKEIDGFTQLIEKAKESGLKIALATMGCKRNIDLVLDELHVKSYFDVIVSGEDISKGKPHPEIYQKTLSLLNIKSNEALVFEDTLKGVNSAYQAGIPVVAVLSTHSKAETQSWPVISSINNYKDSILAFPKENALSITAI